jgi:hypothetical protein
MEAKGLSLLVGSYFSKSGKLLSDGRKSQTLVKNDQGAKVYFEIFRAVTPMVHRKSDSTLNR